MTILASFIFQALIGLNATVDAKRNNKGKGILFGHHLAAWIARYMVAFLDILYIMYQGNVPYEWETVGVFLMYGGFAWVNFDLTYNHHREGVDLDHVGTTSWLDKIFHYTPNPFAFQLIAKILLIGAGVTLMSI